MAIFPRPKIKNFIPTPGLQKILKRSIEKLTELAPSDSYVNTVVEQKAGAYQVEININSTQQRWSVLKLGTAPIEALTDAVGSLLNDLTSWKKNRFK